MLLLKYANDMKSKNNIDFGYLTQNQKIKKKRDNNSEQMSNVDSSVRSSDFAKTF